VLAPGRGSISAVSVNQRPIWSGSVTARQDCVDGCIDDDLASDVAGDRWSCLQKEIRNQWLRIIAQHPQPLVALSPELESRSMPPPGRMRPEVRFQRLAGEVLWLHRSLPSF
jgi:hypothetical protein